MRENERITTTTLKKNPRRRIFPVVFVTFSFELAPKCSLRRFEFSDCNKTHLPGLSLSVCSAALLIGHGR